MAFPLKLYASSSSLDLDILEIKNTSVLFIHT